jgi:hypothetical protein
VLYPGLDVLRCPDIITAVFEASQDVDENRHTQTIKGIDHPGQPLYRFLAGAIPLVARDDLPVRMNEMITAKYGGIRDVLNCSLNY